LWAAHSSAALELARECENLWYNAPIIGGVVLNQTIAVAGCYADAHVTGDATVVGPIATPGSAASAAPAPSRTSGAQSRMDSADMWMLTGGGVAAAAAYVAWQRGVEKLYGIQRSMEVGKTILLHDRNSLYCKYCL
jgi:hypothetical protein